MCLLHSEVCQLRTVLSFDCADITASCSARALFAASSTVSRHTRKCSIRVRMLERKWPFEDFDGWLWTILHILPIASASSVSSCSFLFTGACLWMSRVRVCSFEWLSVSDIACRPQDLSRTRLMNRPSTLDSRSKLIPLSHAKHVCSVGVVCIILCIAPSSCSVFISLMSTCFFQELSVSHTPILPPRDDVSISVSQRPGSQKCWLSVIIRLAYQ